MESNLANKRKLIAEADRITELTESRMQQEAGRARRAQPAPPPAPRPTSSRVRRGSSQSLTSTHSRASRASDAMDLGFPSTTPRSTTRGSQRGSPIKRASESPEKEQRPQKDRRVSSSSMSRTMQSSDLLLEEAVASLSLARLLMPDGSHRPLSDLDEDRRRALETSWDTFTSKVEPFRRWWALLGSGNQCCGGKIISRMDADWEEGRIACKTCPKAKPPRPCLRLTTPVSEDGRRLTRLVEVMPEKGKNGLHAFEYFWPLASISARISDPAGVSTPRKEFCNKKSFTSCWASAWHWRRISVALSVVAVAHHLDTDLFAMPPNALSAPSREPSHCDTFSADCVIKTAF
ncbi:hypothetical protein NU195Hw_g589t1 [Hortaea werneckii]